MKSFIYFLYLKYFKERQISVLKCLILNLYSDRIVFTFLVVVCLPTRHSIDKPFSFFLSFLSNAEYTLFISISDQIHVCSTIPSVRQHLVLLFYCCCELHAVSNSIVLFQELSFGCTSRKSIRLGVIRHCYHITVWIQLC